MNLKNMTLNIKSTLIFLKGSKNGGGEGSWRESPPESIKDKPKTTYIGYMFC